MSFTQKAVRCKIVECPGKDGGCLLAHERDVMCWYTRCKVKSCPFGHKATQLPPPPAPPVLASPAPRTPEDDLKERSCLEEQLRKLEEQVRKVKEQLQENQKREQARMRAIGGTGVRPMKRDNPYRLPSKCDCCGKKFETIGQFDYPVGVKLLKSPSSRPGIELHYGLCVECIEVGHAFFDKFVREFKW